MIKANVIGIQYLAKLELPNGKICEIQLPNRQAYDNLTDNSIQEFIGVSERRAKLVVATEEPLLDTPSGKIEDGYYVVFAEDNVLVQENRNIGYTVESNILNDEIINNEEVTWL